MKRQTLALITAGALTLGAMVLASASGTSKARLLDDDKGNEAELVAIGFKIAPVHLNLEGKDKDLVGLGSYIVNGIADCDGCHTASGPPNFNYANGANPYFIGGKPGHIDPGSYLGGGADFGPGVPPSAAVGGFPPGSIPPSYPPAGFSPFYVGPDMIARNLTPDKNGRPEGGHTLQEFKDILRNGTDLDHIHPTCTGPGDPKVALGTCIPAPVNGAVLQVMPWPAFRHMTDHQIEAIYEYLSTIPCIDNNFSTPPAGAPDELRNDCGTVVAAVPQSPTPMHRRGHRGEHGGS
jgi:hypothetical protein